MSLRDAPTTTTTPDGTATASGAGVRHVTRKAGPADRDPARHARRRRIIAITSAIVFPVVLILLWQLASTQGWISRFDYPAPTDVLSEMKRTFRDNPKGNMWTDVWVSTQRMFWGYLWGVLAGLVLGFALGMSRFLRNMTEPTLNALYTVPKLALISIFLIVFGFGNAPVIAVVTITVFFFVWISAMASVLAVPEGFREAAQSLEAGRWQMFRHVILPASLPQIFVGLRIAAGVAVLTLIGTEMVYPPNNQGIGYRINNARVILDPKQAYVGLVVSAIFGVVFTALIKLLGRVVVPWAPDDKGVA
jgi:sulfonate transport system permease protein